MSRDDSPNDKGCKDSHHNGGDPGYAIEDATIRVSPHQSMVVAEQDHQYKNDWQQHAADHIGQVEHEDQPVFGHEQGDACPCHDDECVQEQELRSLLEGASDATLPAKGFGNRVGRGEG